jgi:hypothetical protein
MANLSHMLPKDIEPFIMGGKSEFWYSSKKYIFHTIVDYLG